MEPEWPPGGVYAIICRPTGWVYVGSTWGFKRRWRQHVLSLDRWTHWHSEMQRDWWRFGSEAFEFRVLEAVPDPYNEGEDLFDREAHWTVFFQAASPSYNQPRVSLWCRECRRKCLASEFFDHLSECAQKSFPKGSKRWQ